MRSTQIYFICCSSLWTCLHHMVILRGQNKITDCLMILAWSSPFNMNTYTSIHVYIPFAYVSLHAGVALIELHVNFTRLKFRVRIDYICTDKCQPDTKSRWAWIVLIFQRWFVEMIQDKIVHIYKSRALSTLLGIYCTYCILL